MLAKSLVILSTVFLVGVACTKRDQELKTSTDSAVQSSQESQAMAPETNSNPPPAEAPPAGE
jgi:hypothetical protein